MKILAFISDTEPMYRKCFVKNARPVFHFLRRLYITLSVIAALCFSIIFHRFLALDKNAYNVLDQCTQTEQRSSVVYIGKTLYPASLFSLCIFCKLWQHFLYSLHKIQTVSCRLLELTFFKFSFAFI